MPYWRLTAAALLALGALFLAGWAAGSRPRARLRYVLHDRWSGSEWRRVCVEDEDCLARAEAWLRSLPGPPLRQRWYRLRGAWCESGLRMADYHLTFVFEDGRCEEVKVWVGGPGRRALVAGGDGRAHHG